MLPKTPLNVRTSQDSKCFIIQTFSIMGGGFMHSGQIRDPSTSFAAARQPLSATSSETNDDCIFGHVPSQMEIERAISDLQRFINGPKSEFGGLKGLLYHHDQSSMLQSPGYVKLRDAFSMMLTEPEFQNMVISISCDKAVWEAILSNKAVQNMQSSIVAAKEERRLSGNEEPDIAILVLRWLIDFTKSKVLDLVEKFGLLVKEIFQPSPTGKSTSELTNLLEEKVRSSLLMTVIILLIVVVTRNQG